MRSDLPTTNIQTRMFSGMCALCKMFRRLIFKGACSRGCARGDWQVVPAAKVSPLLILRQVESTESLIFYLSFFRRDQHPPFRKVEIKWSAISKWPSHTSSFLFFDKWTLRPLYSFVQGSDGSIFFPFVPNRGGKRFDTNEDRGNLVKTAMRNHLKRRLDQAVAC